MNWRDRPKKLQTGSMNSNPANNGSQRGPLRKIVSLQRAGEGLFDRDQVVFECGHEGAATPGAKRGRCAKCKENAKP